MKNYNKYKNYWKNNVHKFIYKADKKDSVIYNFIKWVKIFIIKRLSLIKE